MDIEHESPEMDDEYEVLPEKVGNATNEEELEAVEGNEEAEAEEVEGDEEAEAQVNDEQKEEESAEGECGECTARIWDKAFADPNAVTLSDLFLDTAGEMAADPVCSDTIRYTCKTAETLMTSPGARYTMAMFYKLMWSVSKKLNDDNGLNYKETTRVVNRLLNEQPVQNMVVSAVAGVVQLYQDPVVRERVAKLANVYGSQLKSTIIEKLSNRRNTSAAKRRRTSGKQS